MLLVVATWLITSQKQSPFHYPEEHTSLGGPRRHRCEPFSELCTWRWMVSAPRSLQLPHRSTTRSWPCCVRDALRPRRYRLGPRRRTPSWPCNVAPPLVALLGRDIHVPGDIAKRGHSSHRPHEPPPDAPERKMRQQPRATPRNAKLVAASEGVMVVVVVVEVLVLVVAVVVVVVLVLAVVIVLAVARW